MADYLIIYSSVYTLFTVIFKKITGIESFCSIVVSFIYVILCIFISIL